MVETDDEPLCLLQEIVRIANGRQNVLYAEVVKDDMICQRFEAPFATLKTCRKRGFILFEGELLLLGRHDAETIHLTETGIAALSRSESKEVFLKQGRTVFFDGAEALAEVAKADGKWNWVLIGPDANKLPLAGGGPGAISEMKATLGEHPNTFGVLRLRFGSKTQWVYIIASNVDDESGSAVSMRERGQQVARRAMMERAIGRYVQTHTQIVINNMEDCTPENVVGFLAKRQADGTLFTVERYREGFAYFRKLHPEMFTDDVFDDVQVSPANLTAKVLDLLMDSGDELSPRAGPVDHRSPGQCASDNNVVLHSFNFSDSGGEAECQDFDRCLSVPKEMPIYPPQLPNSVEVNWSVGRTKKRHVGAQSAQNPETPIVNQQEEVQVCVQGRVGKQRKKHAIVRIGDPVRIWGVGANQWHDDGYIVQVAKESVIYEEMGIIIPPGAIMVQYSNNKRFKWVPAEKAKVWIQKSKRPRPPPKLCGELLRETHGIATSWQLKYCELAHGTLAWWDSIEDALRRTPDHTGTITLENLSVQMNGTVIKITNASCKGIIYTFDAMSVISLENWKKALTDHGRYADMMMRESAAMDVDK